MDGRQFPTYDLANVFSDRFFNTFEEAGKFHTKEARKDPNFLSHVIPDEVVEPLSEHLTLFIAQVLQSWIDAGSERDVTLEELYEPIEEHIKSWAYTEWRKYHDG